MVAASVISVVGAASIAGKTGGDWLSDHVDREVVYVLGMALLLASIAALGGVAVAPSPWTAYGYAVLIGLGYAVTASLIPAILGDRFHGAHFAAIFGVAQGGSAMGSALGVWLAGRIFDVTGSYAIALVVAGATALAAGLAVWMARSLRIAAAHRIRVRRGEVMRAVIGGLVVTETAFTLNGVGRFVVDAVAHRADRDQCRQHAVHARRR